MKVGSTIKNLDPLVGLWSAWSPAADGPGAVFLVPVDDQARAMGLKYAVVRVLVAQNASANVLTVIRTDPSRPELCGTPKEREKKEATR